MRHTEVAEAPCQGRNDGDETVWAGGPARRIIHQQHIEVATETECVLKNGRETTGSVHTEDEDDQKCERHDDALDEVRG